jgi:hypothetical protein
MGVLTEYVRKEAEQLKKEIHRREEASKEWTASINQLYGLLESWVRDADGGRGLLGARRMPRATLQEPRLGVYELDCLQIGIGSRFAEIRPRGRYVVATIKPHGKGPRPVDGMVEIRDGGMADYYLFRLNDPDGDHWYIQSVARWNADPEYGNVEELDRDRFEAAILRILK